MYVPIGSWIRKDGFDNDAVMTVVEVKDPSHSLDLKSMKEEELNNGKFIWVVKNHFLGSGKNNTVYTFKTVEDVKLVHKNNHILVPRSKQQSVIDWYHTIQVHPSESRMVETIELVST